MARRLAQADGASEPGERLARHRVLRLDPSQPRQNVAPWLCLTTFRQDWGTCAMSSDPAGGVSQKLSYLADLGARGVFR